jgi:hypothetical protein
MKNAEYWRIIPDIVNLRPKSTFAIAGPNTNINILVISPRTEKYL